MRIEPFPLSRGAADVKPQEQQQQLVPKTFEEDGKNKPERDGSNGLNLNQIVDKTNKAMELYTHLKFSVSKVNEEPTVDVIDSQTGQVVTQLSPPKFIAMAQDISNAVSNAVGKAVGLIVDKYI
ncbi:MAG: flagellar protein FlaG [Peptococcaceae bacterium]|nr:flagellar protein FlaG [Peptococcaceae bacterium]